MSPALWRIVLDPSLPGVHFACDAKRAANCHSMQPGGRHGCWLRQTKWSTGCTATSSPSRTREVLHNRTEERTVSREDFAPPAQTQHPHMVRRWTRGASHPPRLWPSAAPEPQRKSESQSNGRTRRPVASWRQFRSRLSRPSWFVCRDKYGACSGPSESYVELAMVFAVHAEALS